MSVGVVASAAAVVSSVAAVVSFTTSSSTGAAVGFGLREGLGVRNWAMRVGLRVGGEKGRSLMCVGRGVGLEYLVGLTVSGLRVG